MENSAVGGWWWWWGGGGGGKVYVPRPKRRRESPHTHVRRPSMRSVSRSLDACSLAAIDGDRNPGEERPAAAPRALPCDVVCVGVCGEPRSPLRERIVLPLLDRAAPCARDCAAESENGPSSACDASSAPSASSTSRSASARSSSSSVMSGSPPRGSGDVRPPLPPPPPLLVLEIEPFLPTTRARLPAVVDDVGDDAPPPKSAAALPAPTSIRNSTPTPAARTRASDAR